MVRLCYVGVPRRRVNGLEYANVMMGIDFNLLFWGVGRVGIFGFHTERQNAFKLEVGMMDQGAQNTRFML